MDTPCWVWEKGTQKYGYGVFWDGFRQVLAHRFSRELHNGRIPEGLLVCHHCDNPVCIRPDHLFPGTYQDNSRDCWQKGRNTLPHYSGDKNWMVSHPEKTYTCKLNYEIAEQIRNMYAAGGYTHKQLGERFGVTEGNICSIIHRRLWKERMGV